MTSNPNINLNHNSGLHPHVCSCTEHRVFKGAREEYWQSPQGITRRINMLSQDFCYKTVNNSLKMVAPTNNVKWMRWITKQDDRVCPICQKHERGKNNGHYKISWFMPKMPVHKNCRCTWELIF